MSVIPLVLLLYHYIMITDAHWTLLLPPCSDPSCRVPAGRGRPSEPSTSRSPCRCRRLAEHTRRTANQKSHGWNAWKIRRNITENCKKAGFMMIYADWCGFLLMITMPYVSYVQCHLPYHHIYINHLRPSWGIPKTIAKTIAGWWCWLCPSEEKWWSESQWGWDDIYHFSEMENHPFMFQSPPPR